MIEQPFWLVWVPGGGEIARTDNPKKRHATFESAQKEAQRLAQHQGRPAYVLQGVGVAKPMEPPIEWFPVGGVAE
jgi:hypothetical protein